MYNTDYTKNPLHCTLLKESTLWVYDLYLNKGCYFKKKEQVIKCWSLLLRLQPNFGFQKTYTQTILICCLVIIHGWKEVSGPDYKHE